MVKNGLRSTQKEQCPCSKSMAPSSEKALQLSDSWLKKFQPYNPITPMMSIRDMPLMRPWISMEQLSDHC